MQADWAVYYKSLFVQAKAFIQQQTNLYLAGVLVRMIVANTSAISKKNRKTINLPRHCIADHPAQCNVIHAKLFSAILPKNTGCQPRLFIKDSDAP